MASRPTTSTHWALCSRGSRWALSSSVRLWILPAWWERAEQWVWEWAAPLIHATIGCIGSHLETMRGCFLGLKTVSSKVSGGEGKGAEPLLFFYFSFLVLWLTHDKVMWIQSQLIQPRGPGGIFFLQSKLDWQQLLAVTADNNITLEQYFVTPKVISNQSQWHPRVS